MIPHFSIPTIQTELKKEDLLLKQYLRNLPTINRSEIDSMLLKEVFVRPLEKLLLDFVAGLKSAIILGEAIPGFDLERWRETGLINTVIPKSLDGRFYLQRQRKQKNYSRWQHHKAYEDGKQNPAMLDRYFLPSPVILNDRNTYSPKLISQIEIAGYSPQKIKYLWLRTDLVPSNWKRLLEVSHLYYYRVELFVEFDPIVTPEMIMADKKLYPIKAGFKGFPFSKRSHMGNYIKRLNFMISKRDTSRMSSSSKQYSETGDITWGQVPKDFLPFVLLDQYQLLKVRSEFLI